MLYFKVGQTEIGRELECSFCPHVSPPFERVYVMETDPINEATASENGAFDYVPDQEFESMCGDCFKAIKSAVTRFPKLIATDFDFVVQGLRVPTETMRVQTH